MSEHPYTDCVCPMVRELDMTWLHVTTFKVSWQPSPWCGSGAGDRGARVGSGCEVGIPLCSVAVTALSGARSDPMLLEQKPRGSGSTWLCFL